MIDKNAIYDDLTLEFIQYQYGLDNPKQRLTDTKAMMIARYENDSVFNCKVKQFVSGVMSILDKHI